MTEWKRNSFGWPVWDGWKTVREIGKNSFSSVYLIQRDEGEKTEDAALRRISIPQNENDIEELYNRLDKETIAAHYRNEAQELEHEYFLLTEMKECSNIVFHDAVASKQHPDEIGWDILIKEELLTPLGKKLKDSVGYKDVIRLGIHICNALACCEDRNILHRNIKPESIFVTNDGIYKLGDFGIGKQFQYNMSQPNPDVEEFMAPEVHNNQMYDHRSDLYSLGLVLYWLLNEKRLPFLSLPPKDPTAAEEEEARYRRFHGEVLIPPEHGEDELNTIIMKACAFDPLERFQNAEEMLSALKQLVDPVISPKDDPPPVPWKWILVFAAVSALFITIIGIWSRKTDLYIMAESQTFMYDGEPHSLHQYDVKGLRDNHIIEKVVFDPASVITNAGVQKNTINDVTVAVESGNEAVDKRYSKHYESGVLTVTKYPLVLTAVSDEKIYDGTALINEEVEPVILANPKHRLLVEYEIYDAEGNCIENWPIDTGRYVKKITNITVVDGEQDVTDNYEITTEDGTLVINELPVVTITGPSIADLADCNEQISLPNDESWLRSYETKYVKTLGGEKAYLRYEPSIDLSFFSYVYEKDMVTVLAKQNDYSLVKTQNGEIGWVTSSVLVDSY